MLLSLAFRGISDFEMCHKMPRSVTGKRSPASPLLPKPEGSVRLDAKTVAALKLDGKRDVIFFDDMAGFGHRLRLGANGKMLRSWIVQYRRAGGTRRITLGPADVLSAEQARAAAKKILGRVALGEDPQGDRIERRGKDRLTVGAIVADYLDLKKGEVKRTTRAAMHRYLGEYFKPLHTMPIDVVSRKDVASRLVAITRGHGSIVAARARAALSAFFAWSMREGLCEQNPCIGTNRPKENPARDRVLSDSELAAIWRACGDDDHGRIVRLLILTGCRRAEIGGLAWSEIDDAGTWTLPKARSKNGRPHALPLPLMALRIVESVPRMVGRDQLFGMRSPNGFSAWDLRKGELDARSGVADWTHHDLRRTVATRMADLGILPHVIEQILNHVSGHKGGIAGVYNRSSYEREVRAALAMWEDHIRVLVEGGVQKIIAFTS
jgi:integrase